MKKITLLFSLFLASFMLNAQTTVTRKLDSFKKIAISGAYQELILKSGSSESVTIEGEGVDLEKIKTKVHKNSLNISTENGTHKTDRIKITVTYRELTAIVASGSTDINCTSAIKGEKFEYASSGSGDFKGEFDVDHLEIAISGSSDLSLQGQAGHQEYAISGSGDVNAKTLKGNTADVAISGSSEVNISVSGKVKSAVSGTGKVTNNK
ncbi:MAG: head GIN domain-containing protein [Saprospiraceae bacterium]